MQGQRPPYLHFPPVIKTLAKKLTIFPLVSRVNLEHNLPSCPLSYLLLKPISVYHANCLMCSPYRLTLASVLSSYTDSVSITPIVYYASQLWTVSCYSTGSPLSIEPPMSRQSYTKSTPSQVVYYNISLLLTKIKLSFSSTYFACSFSTCFACSPIPYLFYQRFIEPPAFCYPQRPTYVVEFLRLVLLGPLPC